MFRDLWRSRDEGFTLIEVLAALVIFSVSILGLISSITHATRTAALLELRTFAGIVAENQIAYFRATCTQPNGPQTGPATRQATTVTLDCNRVGGTRGEQSLFNQTFNFTLTREQTEHSDIRKLTVSVFDDETFILSRDTYFRSPSVDIAQGDNNAPQ